MLVNMKTMLAVANEHNFAVPAFNTPTGMIMRGILEASEAAKAPVIIEVHPLELELARPSFITALVEEAHKASVPVCIHMDHGSSLEQIMTAIQCGYTSVMIDASSKSFEENVALTKKICEVAHAVNVSVEAELGTIGTTKQDMDTTSSTEIRYTDPQEAARFVEETGVDCLAVAIGTCHGIYPKGMIPKLQLDLLKEIKEAVKIPLVLHGGSSNRDEEIAAASRMGINKINISSDIKDPFYRKCREVLQDPYIREPDAIYPPCIEAMKEVIFHKFDLLGTTGKAHLYY
ncbi:MAG: ketose-bisphosphate aldolase [Oscillospiraceae bacterium]|nr:ketose-bisphosphate aldolase [Oscillospiraceae bacterium]